MDKSLWEQRAKEREIKRAFSEYIIEYSVEEVCLTTVIFSDSVRPTIVMAEMNEITLLRNHPWSIVLRFYVSWVFCLFACCPFWVIGKGMLTRGG